MGVLELNTPRVVISGISSGCGKTTVATGLMGALSSAGLRVQGFKLGPDFIDPSYHTAVTGRKSRNLDAWMLSRRAILGLFQQSANGCDIAIVEGVMGLFDGIGGKGRRGSSADMARLLRSPVILVVDVGGMGGSAAAIVAGSRALDRRLRIAGVILNRVSSERHAEMCRSAIESATRVPVVGAVPRDAGAKLPERHLGLVPMAERPDLRTALAKIAESVKANVDLKRILEISRAAPSLREAPPKRAAARKAVRIAVAYDEAFNFYYQDALDTLSAMGADVHFFSPVHDRSLPEDFDGLYLGGGFPEVLARELESNQSIRSSIKKRVEEGTPVFAECGGLMYLTRGIIGFEGERRQMVGAIDCETRMVKKLTLSYTDARVQRENVLAKPGLSVRGHEFHHSQLEGVPSDASFAYSMRRGSGIDGGRDGWIEHNTLAQYTHINFAGSSRLASNFVKSCLRNKRR